MFLGILFLFLTACRTVYVYVDVPVPYLRDPLGITPPPALVLDDVAVLLVKPATDTPIYFKLDQTSYKGLLLNNKLVEGYIRESNSRLESCEAYYTEPLKTEQ